MSQPQPLPSLLGMVWAHLPSDAGELDDRIQLDDKAYYQARAAAETACANAAMHPKARAAHLELAIAYRRLAAGAEPA